ncbi:hypothetical protein JCM14467A_09940 [Vulcanisaeta sp. JCM 14467]
MDQVNGQAQIGALTFKMMINEPAKHLFHFMVLNETDAFIVGPKGVGKTRLVMNALMNVPSDYAVVVFDVAGNYEGFTDYHAPYPFNPFDHLDGIEILDVLSEVLTMRFPRLSYVMTPAMEYMFMFTYNELTKQGEEGQEGQQQAKPPISITDIIKYLSDAIKSGAIAREDEVNSARGLIRRLSYFNHWIFQKTHPLINRLFKGELRGRSIGIDLRWLTPVQRWFYVLSFLATANAVDARNLIFIIDEAHLYFRLGESTLTTSVRIGRNYRRYFALITQSIFDVPEEFISMNKLFIVFPTMFHKPENVLFREVGFKAYFGRNEFYDVNKNMGGLMPPHWAQPHSALMFLHITNKQLLDMTAEKKPYHELLVTVDTAIKPKPLATTLSQCARAYGVDLGVIRESGFTHRSLNALLQGVWECIGTP